MESRASRSESRRSFLKKLAGGGAFVWAVPAIAFAAHTPKSRPPSVLIGQCVGDDPSHGHCDTDAQCFPQACDHTACTPSCCWCTPSGQWECTNDCHGHCA
jgi:hypothetical protein